MFYSRVLLGFLFACFAELLFGKFILFSSLCWPSFLFFSYTSFSGQNLGHKAFAVHNSCILFLNRAYFSIYLNETTPTQPSTRKVTKISREVLKKKTNNKVALNYYMLRHYKSINMYKNWY